MTIRTGIVAVLLSVTLCVPGLGQGQTRSTEQLGKVDFQNSCSPAVQETFQRGVAMLHSFWYTEAEKTFREVLAGDPSCAIAAWGIAAILMSNPLGGVGPQRAGPSAPRRQSSRVVESVPRPRASATT